MIVAAAATMGAASLWLAIGAHRAAPSAEGIRVIDGGVAALAPPPSAPVVVTRRSAPRATLPPRRAPRPVAVAALAHADDDGQLMGRLTVDQAADPRGSGIEQTVLATLRSHAPGMAASGTGVTCTITLCEISGVAIGMDPAATRTALRAPPLLSAMAGLGYSTGPDEESPAPGGGTAFVFYFNRVM